MMRQTGAILLSLLGLSSGVLAEGALAPVSIPRSPAESGKTCILNPLGNNQDDVPQILKAFEACNNGGTVVFPEDSTFYIATKLNPVIYDVTIDWKGTWLVCLAYRFSNEDDLCGLGILIEIAHVTQCHVLVLGRLGLLALKLLPDSLSEPRCGIYYLRREDSHQWLRNWQDQRQR